MNAEGHHFLDGFVGGIGTRTRAALTEMHYEQLARKFAGSYQDPPRFHGTT